MLDLVPLPSLLPARADTFLRIYHSFRLPSYPQTLIGIQFGQQATRGGTYDHKKSQIDPSPSSSTCRKQLQQARRRPLRSSDCRLDRRRARRRRDHRTLCQACRVRRIQRPTAMGLTPEPRHLWFVRKCSTWLHHHHSMSTAKRSTLWQQKWSQPSFTALALSRESRREHDKSCSGQVSSSRRSTRHLPHQPHPDRARHPPPPLLRIAKSCAPSLDPTHPKHSPTSSRC